MMSIRACNTYVYLVQLLYYILCFVLLHGGGSKVESSTESVNSIPLTNKQTKGCLHTIMTLISCRDDAISKQLYRLDYIGIIAI